MSTCLKWFLAAGGLLAALLLARPATSPLLAGEKDAPPSPKIGEGTMSSDFEWQVPRERWKIPFKDEQPILFVNRNQAADAWDKLPHFWNETTEKAVDPRTGEAVMRKAVKIKVPLGLTVNPPVPAENAMTVAKWKLGKQLYFSDILSSDGTISCSSCHDPRRGYTDQSPVSTGIRGLKGGMSAPTVFNSSYNVLQFWDGRAFSLEDQAQGPVQNPVEMFSGEGHAWNSAVLRVRQDPKYIKQFRSIFGTDPTRDGIAKAIATYERTVLSGNSIHDRADLAMRVRAEDEGTGKFEIKAKDYETVLRAAFDAKDEPALGALGLNVQKDRQKVAETAKSINNGRALFFGKARCNSCHAGDNFTDNQFHNLGVAVKDGQLPANALGRFASQPTGHKSFDLLGAFKTPTLRHLLGTAPYMHIGSERTLEEVVDFYDRGGNANEFLDSKMRDFEAEKAYLLSQQNHTSYKGPEIKLFGKDQKPIVPLKLNLMPQEKRDLVLFLRALQGDPAAPIVADRRKMPE
ncbi:MAG TPA: cytochrome c peroxidase [Gemmataceae bacterium]|nr:cytochrome c peroxidase [Gemmataceae bacterium]